MAALLDSGLAATDTRIEVPGCIRSADRQLCDDWAHDTMLLTATGAISFSSNVGMMLLTRQMDKGVLVDYLSSFGLGQATGLNWPGEQTGDLPSATMTSLTRDEVAYGQGLSVTAVQMAAAVAGLVNGGTYNSPKLVRAAWNSDGTPYEVPAQTTRQVISATASADLVAMMETANIKNNRGIEGYRTAGKTGTADRYNETCACYSGTVGSYVVVAPAEDPEILVYVALDDPTSGQYGSVVAQPAATDILKVALPRLGVAPSTTEGQELPIYWE
jgi:cell division protein FtsI (penicillin-binding protein 3)